MPPQPTDDYYLLLGVHPGAAEDELRRAWRELAARWHPDRAGDDATATFQRLSAAYAVLCDPVARAAYDRRRRAASSSRSEASATPPPPASARAAAAVPPRPARRPAPAAMLRRLCGNLTTLLACGAARLDEPGYVTLVLSEAEAAQGGMASISMRVELRCPDCLPKGAPANCARCGGRGTIEELYSAWLAIPPGVAAGEELLPSAELPGMLDPVRFLVQFTGAS